jgi:hypothetical protein
MVADDHGFAVNIVYVRPFDECSRRHHLIEDANPFSRILVLCRRVVSDHGTKPVRCGRSKLLKEVARPFLEAFDIVSGVQQQLRRGLQALDESQQQRDVLNTIVGEDHKAQRLRVPRLLARLSHLFQRSQFFAIDN